MFKLRFTPHLDWALLFGVEWRADGEYPDTLTIWFGPFSVGIDGWERYLPMTRNQSHTAQFIGWFVFWLVTFQLIY